MVIGIGAGMNQTKAAAWVETHGITHPVLADPSRVAFNPFSMGYVPHNAVLNCNRVIGYTNYGFEETQILQVVTTKLQDVGADQFVPLRDTENTTDPVLFEIPFVVNSPFMAGYPVLYYRTDSGSFQSVIMTSTRWETYTASIPAQPQGTMVSYYFDIRNEAGCNRLKPFAAPAEVFSFNVIVDTIPPSILHTPHTEVANTAWPVGVTATVSDNIGIDSVTLEYQINSGAVESVTMIEDGSNYAAMFAGTVQPDDTVDYRIVAVDSSMTGNIAYHPESGYHRITIIEPLAAAIIDLDSTHNSGTVIRDTLMPLLGSPVYTTAMPLTLANYRSLFVCLGVYNGGSHVLSGAEADALKSFLDQGGRLYMEGGETWAYDAPTVVHPFFHINGLNDGSNNAGPLNGIAGQPTEGMIFGYQTSTQYNNYIDQLGAGAGAVNLLIDGNNSYYTCVSYDGTTYKTVGSSVKFGGLIEQGTGTRSELMQLLLTYFEIPFVVPTPTIIPTSTPAQNTPTPPVPTSTPTATSPESTPTPTVTQSAPTATPVPGDPSIQFTLSQNMFHSGDLFKLDVTISNPTTPKTIAEYIVLDIYGTLYFFWPGWTQEVDFIEINLPIGYLETENILEFNWPENAGAASGLMFWAAMIDPTTMTLYGDYDSVEFSYE